MGHGKETPRQKMIGMMYLVLTALLALNVSKEVLDAFVLVDNGLQVTTEAFAAKNEAAYGRFAFLNEDNEEKVGMWLERANEVQSRTDLLFNFIQQCKLDIIGDKDEKAIHDGIINWHEVKVLDNLVTGAEVMISEESGRRYKELKRMIDDLREYDLSIIDDHEKYASIVETIKNNLNTEPPEKISHKKPKKGETMSWQSGYFEDLPLAAVITMLSKMQADVRNAENEMLGFLLGQVDAGSIPVNALEAVVVPERSLVFLGQEYRAEVFLAAYDTTKMPTITLSDGSTLEVAQGKGIYSTSSNTIGIRRWGGTITLEHEGRIFTEAFNAEYEVAAANATISATAMNVFYRGLDNPVEISAGTVAESSVRATINNPHLIKRVGPGVYTVKPGVQGDKATVSVYAEVDGASKFIYKMDFRVKNLPTPTAKITGSKNGQASLRVSDLIGLQIVEAEADESFEFEVEFKVTEFSMGFTDASGIWGSKKSAGNQFTGEMKTLFRNMRVGSRITLQDIKALGPDGNVRPLSPINITVR